MQMVQVCISCAPPAWCHVKYQLAGAGLFFSCLSEAELQAGKIVLCLNTGMWLGRNKFDSWLYRRLPMWVGSFACSLRTLCLNCQGQIKICAAQLEDLWYLEIQAYSWFFLLVLESQWPGQKCYVYYGGTKAANQEWAPSILETTQRDNKTLSSPQYSLF